MSAIVSHPYRPKTWKMVVLCVLATGFTAMMAWIARHADRSLVFKGVLLDAEEAATLFTAFAVFGVALLAFGLLSLLVSRYSRHRLTLTDTELSTPRSGYTRAVAVIPLGDIREVRLERVQSGRLLKVRHARGKVTILEAMLPGRAAFDELCTALIPRLPAGV